MAETVDDVILHLHTGASSPVGWSQFLQSARVFTGADYASLVFRRANAAFHDMRMMNCGTQFAIRDLSGLETVMNRCELPYDRIASEQPFALDAILALGGRGRAHYQAYLADRALIDTVVVRVTEPEGGNAWLTLGRSRRQFGRAAGDFLGRIASHLKVATRTLAVLEREQMRAEIATDAMKRLGLGWVSFDVRGRVLDLEGPIEHLFGAAPRGAPLRLEAAIQSTVRDAIATLALDPGAAPRAIRLSETPRLDMVMMPISYRTVSHGALPAAVGYLRGDARELSTRCVELARLFTLTPNEARLALALTRGLSLAEAGAELKLSIETTRTYSKRLYAKTGTRGQTDLVRTILSGVLALT